MRATKVNAGLAESNGRLLLGIWRDSLHVTCGPTACTPGSAPGPTLGNEYGKTLPFLQSSLISQTELVCVQLPTSAVNVALPAFAAARRAAAPCCCGTGRAAVDRYRPPAGPTAANPPHASAAEESDRRTDGRTPYR